MGKTHHIIYVALGVLAVGYLYHLYEKSTATAEKSATANNLNADGKGKVKYIHGNVFTSGNEMISGAA